MEEQELIKFLGTTIVNNWIFIFTSFFTILGSCIAGSWWLSNIFNKQKISILQLQLRNQNDRFTQFESIVDQRINFLKHEAELLQNKVSTNPPKTIVESSQSSQSNYLDTTAFLRKSNEESLEVTEPKNEYLVSVKIKNFLESTDVINRIIKTASYII
ncbi:MAG: hypothetical protein ACI9EK_001917 [Psychroserpens sp.]|jgi:hypothetical protein